MASWASLAAAKPTDKKGNEGRSSRKRREENTNSWRLGVKDIRHSAQQEQGRHQHVLPLDVWIHIAGLLEVKNVQKGGRLFYFYHRSSSLFCLLLCSLSLLCYQLRVVHRAE